MKKLYIILTVIIVFILSSCKKEQLPETFYICDPYFGGTGKTQQEIDFEIKYNNIAGSYIRPVHFRKGTHQPNFQKPKEQVCYLDFDVKFSENCLYNHYNPEHDTDWSKITGLQQYWIWEHFGDCPRISWRTVFINNMYVLEVGHYTWIKSTSPQATGYKGSISYIQPNSWYNFKIMADKGNFYFYFDGNLVHTQTRQLPDNI